MQQTGYQQPTLCRMITPLKPTFRLFIACEDQAAFMQARKVQHQVEALCGREIEISRVLWNFSLLRHAQLREYAVLEAAEADMIVISFRAGCELPPHVKRWMESLPVRPQAGQAALVRLIGHTQESWAERRSHIAYTRNTQHKKRYARNNRSNSYSALAVGDGHLLHHGRVNSHPACYCHNRRSAEVDSGEKYLMAGAYGRGNSLFAGRACGKEIQWKLSYENSRK